MTVRGYMVLVLGSLLSSAAFGEEAAAAAATPEFDPVSTLWVLLAAILVFFMQAGFGMVEAGLIRAKNSANVLMKNLVDFSFAAIGYYTFGYAIMWGSAGLIVGTTGWFMFGAVRPVDTLPLSVFWLFQAVFAATALTIASGAMAERTKFTSYLIFSTVM